MVYAESVPRLSSAMPHRPRRSRREEKLSLASSGVLTN
jgi:hypothetical protein